MARDERSDPRGSSARAIGEVLRALASGRSASDAGDEGLRERKKRLTRQHISDTATAMFLERGFDEVRVAEVAAACDVSEKTVYNYFPTKESLVFDRTDELADALRAAVREQGDGRSIGDAVLAGVHEHIEHVMSWWGQGPDGPATTRRFAEMVEATPSLRAARQEMFDELTQAAAEALAERAGVAPTDPEPQLAALLVVGLWRIAMRSLQQHADSGAGVAAARAAVTAEVRRAARMADAGLSSFDAAVRRDTGRQAANEAADAVQEARRQVVAAVKQARVAWRQVRELHDQHDATAAAASSRAASQLARMEVKRATQQLKQEMKREAMKAAHDAQRERQQARQKRPDRGR